MDIAALTLLHALVLVYWLGGDLGAFVASFTVTDRRAPTPARLSAARLVGAVDMAPRTALILAAPTGVTLAAANGWIGADAWLLAATWAVFLAWLALAWRQHLAHGAPSPAWARVDLALRIVFLIALLAAAAAMTALPAFLRLKLVLLAAAVGAGLAVRWMLRPFGPALAALAANAGGDAHNAVIASSLGRARIAVVTIWALVLAAAWLGLAQPV